jgi:hypothetical protein
VKLFWLGVLVGQIPLAAIGAYIAYAIRDYRRSAK